MDYYEYERIRSALYAGTVVLDRVICIMGPTASGKTDWACSLSDQLNGRIISVDSALIYKGMDIGTAKPTPEELKRYPHRLIDLIEPHETYSVASFCQDAKREIDAALSEGKVPILVGGTMMYFRALLLGLSEIPAANPEVRERLLQEGEQLGWKALHQRLLKVDPEVALQIKPQDRQRIIRGLEVYEISGRPLSSFWEQKQCLDLPYHFECVALMPKDRALLHMRINLRLYKMMEQGFLDEVRGLWERGTLNKEMPAIRTVGYRQLWEYLEGHYPTLEEAVEKAAVATRQLAKRQMTWIRNWPDLLKIDLLDRERFEKKLNKMCSLG